MVGTRLSDPARDRLVNLWFTLQRSDLPEHAQWLAIRETEFAINDAVEPRSYHFPGNVSAVTGSAEGGFLRGVDLPYVKRESIETIAVLLDLHTFAALWGDLAGTSDEDACWTLLLACRSMFLPQSEEINQRTKQADDDMSNEDVPYSEIRANLEILATDIRNSIPHTRPI